MAGLENYNINDPSTWGSRGDGTTKGTKGLGVNNEKWTRLEFSTS